MRSVVVVLPASMWAMMPILRVTSSSVFAIGVSGFGYQVSGFGRGIDDPLRQALLAADHQLVHEAGQRPTAKAGIWSDFSFFYSRATWHFLFSCSRPATVTATAGDCPICLPTSLALAVQRTAAQFRDVRASTCYRWLKKPISRSFRGIRYERMATARQPSGLSLRTWTDPACGL